MSLSLYPRPHLVTHGEAADHDGDGQGDDEHAAQGAQSTHKLAHEGPENYELTFIHVLRCYIIPRLLMVAHCGECHQPPPDAVIE